MFSLLVHIVHEVFVEYSMCCCGVVVAAVDGGVRRFVPQNFANFGIDIFVAISIVDKDLFGSTYLH